MRRMKKRKKKEKEDEEQQLQFDNNFPLVWRKSFPNSIG